MATPDHRWARVLYRDTLGLTMVQVDDFAAVFNRARTMPCVSKIPDWRVCPHTVLRWIVRDLNDKVRARGDKGATFEISPQVGQSPPGIFRPPGGGLQITRLFDPHCNNLSLMQLSGQRNRVQEPLGPFANVMRYKPR